MKNKEVIVHGECFVFSSVIPEHAKLVVVNESYKIIADSETTGNHHVVDYMVGVEFFETENALFMKNSVPTQIRCVLADRHDSVVLEPNTWEFGIQKEYDHVADELRKVRD